MANYQKSRVDQKVAHPVHPTFPKPWCCFQGQHAKMHLKLWFGSCIPCLIWYLSTNHEIKELNKARYFKIFDHVLLTTWKFSSTVLHMQTISPWAVNEFCTLDNSQFNVTISPFHEERSDGWNVWFWRWQIGVVYSKGNLWKLS